MPEFAERTQRPPDSSSKEPDKRGLPGATRRDIASFGTPSEAWRAQFAPRPKTVIPNLARAKEWQDWAGDLGSFSLEEARRLKMSSLLQHMIENLPPEVYLPTNQIISSSKNLIVTGTTDAIPTGAIRNKLYTAYLSIERPQEIESYERNIRNLVPNGPLFEYDFKPRSFEVATGIEPFEVNLNPYTERERNVLYFLFKDEMIDWARRHVERKESVEHEAEWRGNVAFGQIAAKHLAITQWMLTQMVFSLAGAAAAPRIAGFIAPRLFGVGAAELGSASFLTRLGVGATTSGIVGGSIGAVESAATNLRPVISGDVSVSDYFGQIAADTWSGAKWGTLFGAGGEVAAAGFGKLMSILRSQPPRLPGTPIGRLGPPAAEPAVTAMPSAGVQAPAKQAGSGWFARRAREVIFKTMAAVGDAGVTPTFAAGGGPSQPVPALSTQRTATAALASGKTLPPGPSTPIISEEAPLPLPRPTEATVSAPAAATSASQQIGSASTSQRAAANAIAAQQAVTSTAGPMIGSLRFKTPTRLAGTRLKSWLRDVYIATSVRGYRSKVERLLKRNPDGPLSKALLTNGRIVDYDPATAHLAGPRVFIAGHAGSRRAGHADVIILTSAERNAEFSRDLENTGDRLAEAAYVIQDIAVERLTAWDLVRAGRLDAKYLREENLIRLTE